MLMSIKTGLRKKYHKVGESWVAQHSRHYFLLRIADCGLRGGDAISNSQFEKQDWLPCSAWEPPLPALRVAVPLLNPQSG